MDVYLFSQVGVRFVGNCDCRYGILYAPTLLQSQLYGCFLQFLFFFFFFFFLLLLLLLLLLQDYKGTNVVLCCHYSITIKNYYNLNSKYSDTSANEDNSFRNNIRQPKRDFLPTQVGLPYVMWSAHFFVTHIQTEKISSWNGPTIHVCCYASTKTFVNRIHIRQPSPKNSEKIFVS